jgi:hypothetical protein
MGTQQALRLKELEKENARLQKLVADLWLDRAILQESLRGNSYQGKRTPHPCGAASRADLTTPPGCFRGPERY